LLQRIQNANVERQKTISALQGEIEELQRVRIIANNALSNLQALNLQMENLKANISREETSLAELTREFEEKQKLEKELRLQLETIRAEIGKFDLSQLENAKNQRDEAYRRFFRLDSELKMKGNNKRDLMKRLEEAKERIDNAQQKAEQVEKIGKIIEVISNIRDAYRSIQPKLRSEFISILRNFVQQILDSLVGGEGPLLNVIIDETYTPYVKSESGAEREVSNLSGGERTLIAFAYRLGLGQLIMQSRTGHGLSMLLLDEPTESLGREDGSIDRLAEAISRLKAIEQIIAVTHSEGFAEKAEHVIRLDKEAGESRVSVEK
jgi:exonuclease SbcC